MAKVFYNVGYLHTSHILKKENKKGVQHADDSVKHHVHDVEAPGASSTQKHSEILPNRDERCWGALPSAEHTRPGPRGELKPQKGILKSGYYTLLVLSARQLLVQLP